ncbi:LLM class flavin-dependent oxidoreductase [Alkalihalophilus marmarensis]|uniref:LLM class flavin-dependent oxidoreductase n=1 Tax=Alkalihalophilus marmarensis TaxID=521377 RepID=UPI002DBCF3E1|nr:LLM class flavin-dependent oxidoreductase [Alkalihalophilus marmarensis]MEC2070438.1 LLM class flavin-dependent oxidoreductase [Alkalihalophilus marmarensis]
MKLSILDQSPISVGYTPKEALEASVHLAKKAEELGYERYWIAEHHDFPALSCPAPEVMLSYIGAQTKTIRIGAGAILLPHYKPYKVAETFHLLATLFPGRIDLGIGRAPGGSAEASMALSDNYLKGVRELPEALEELLHFIRNDFSSDHLFQKVTASPFPPVAPAPWLLGTSERSAALAAKMGMAYAFGHFMSDKDVKKSIATYQESFQASPELKQPKTILAASVICAETTERAEEVASSYLLWKRQVEAGEGRQGISSIEEAKKYSFNAEEKKRLSQKLIIGNPDEVSQRLLEFKDMYKVDEVMIVTITHSYRDRIKSYELVADAFK